MAEINLFVCCHQPDDVPQHPLLVPMQVGTTLGNSRFPGFLHDDTGDNISARNRSYCELTAQYWAWKNVMADYYGFFHYRRYLYPDTTAKSPYRVEREATLPLLERLGYSDFAKLIEVHDLIAPKGEDMHIPAREHYASAPYHHRKDLELMEQIVRERCPEMTMAAEQYLSDTVCYFGNIYIMKREVFQDYCTWLFSLLTEFDYRADLQGYDAQERRVDGYLGERLFGIYLTYYREELKTLELPRVHFYGVGVPYHKQRALNALLPPGGRRRSLLKKVWRGMAWHR